MEVRILHSSIRSQLWGHAGGLLIGNPLLAPTLLFDNRRKDLALRAGKASIGIGWPRTMCVAEHC
jgi:hypothetical protein